MHILWIKIFLSYLIFFCQLLDSDSESDVSDTDVEEDESSLSKSDIEPTATGHGVCYLRGFKCLFKD